MRNILLVCAVLLTLMVLGLGFNHGNNFHTVIDAEIHRSAQPDGTELMSYVDQQNIRSVINLRGENSGKDWYDEEKSVSRQLGLEHYDIRLGSDKLPPYTEIQKLLEVLDNAPRPLLLHCEHGADRSGLASALSLMLYADASPDTAARQYSPLYWVFRLNTTGRLLLKQYRQWLDSHELAHSPDRLRKWLKNDYADGKGNLAYYVDQINGVIWKSGTRFEDGYSYQVKRDRELSISGWTVDRKNPGPVSKVDLYLDDRRLGPVTYGNAYKGVAKLFGDPVYLNSGWRISENISEWPRRCYKLYQEVTRRDAGIWRSPPLATVCMR